MGSTHTRRISEKRTPEAPSDRQACKAVLLCTAALSAVWAFDFFFLRPPVLTPFDHRPPLTPLYAFGWPVLRPQLLVFAVAVILLVPLVCRLADPARLRRPFFLLLLFALALILPCSLFMVRQDVIELGTQFQTYPGEEFYDDAQKIANLPEFLRSYVDRMPYLSLHGRHFPPGHAMLLYGVRRLLGPGTLPAGGVILFCFALGMICSYLAIAQQAEDARARQGVLLLLACPSLLDFACTSMDAVFFLYASLAWWLGLRTFSDGGRPLHAVLTGAALLAATGASFSALPVGLILGLFGLANYRRLGRRALGFLGIIGASYASLAVATYLLTGFALWSCFLAAQEQNLAFMTRVMQYRPEDIYFRLAYGNLAGFAVGSGVALVSAAGLRLKSERLNWERWPAVLLVVLLVMIFGGFYMMETERIWLYAMPWLALAAALGEPFSCRSLRILLSSGWIQALVMELLLFTLW